MSTIPAMYNRNSEGEITGVTFYLDFVPYQSDASHPNFSALLEELKQAQPNAERLVALTQPIQAIKEAVKVAEEADYLPPGVVGVTSSQVTFNGEPVKGVLTDRILSMLAEGFDIMPMVKFLENVSLNPAPWSRDDLYLWLENSNLPITADGHFLAYKMVSDDYRSRNNFLNLPGTTVSMPRQACDPDRDQLCSTGLHFCSKDYIHRGYFGQGNKIVMLKINPADVVAIPNEYGHAKGRAWKYEILGDFTEDPHAKSWPSVVNETGDEIVAEDVDDDDEPLEFPSDLTGALFAAWGEIEEEGDGRDERLDWANAVLPWDRPWVNSFHELTKGEARRLIEKAREHKELLDAEADEAADDAQAEAEIAAAQAKQARIDAINSYGIVRLRRETGKWKGYKAHELRRILIDRLG